MRRFIANLQDFQPDIDAGQIADILWLALRMASGEPPPRKDSPIKDSPASSPSATPPGDVMPDGTKTSTSSEGTPAKSDSVSVSTEEVLSANPLASPAVGPTIRVAAAKSLRRPIELERALRPLMRKVPSRRHEVLDEVATAERIAETGMKIAVGKAEMERWLDLALVVEETSLTEIWHKTIDEFQWILEHLGAFRDVRAWTMRRDRTGNLELFPRPRSSAARRRSYTHKELKTLSGQRLILVLSDCTSLSWWEGKVHDWLVEWAKANLVTVVQLLPQRLWKRGILGEGLAVQLRTPLPGAPNPLWEVEELPVWWTPERVENLEIEVKLPVTALEPAALKQWALAVSGLGASAATGVLFERDWRSQIEQPQLAQGKPEAGQSAEQQNQIAKQLVSQFRATASPLARRLAVLMAAAPVDLRVVELIQETMIPDSQQVHVAEVYFSELLTRQVDAAGKTRYQFKPGVRQELRKSLAKSEALSVLDKVSAYIATRLGKEIQGFTALLLADLPEETQSDEEVLAFAEITLDTLRQMGDQYASFAKELARHRTDKEIGQVKSEFKRIIEYNNPISQTNDYVEHRGRYALVVGINIYNCSGLRNLQAPAEDAEAIAQLLENYGEFQVVRRLPEAVEDSSPHVAKGLPVTLKQLKEALVQLFKPEGRNIPETALFYLSGHGLRETLGIAQGFLATSDSAPDDEKWGISLRWLRDLLRESPVRQQIIWLDCCHSGELVNFDEGNPGEQQGKSRCFIAASREYEYETAYPSLETDYSVLTEILRRGLDPNRCRGEWITNYSLIQFLIEQLKNTIQHPLFSNFGEVINLTRIRPNLNGTPSKNQASSGICPYKGLRYFDYNEEDPKYFYGREQLTDQLLDKVRQSDFLAIVGASGSGKSSVLRAGLLHQLKQGRKFAGSGNWKIQILMPGEHPLQSLAKTFPDPNLSKKLLARGIEGLELLIEASDAPRVVIVIDQFEEVFTLCEDEIERQQFLQCLLKTAEKLQGKLCLILAMRADFFGKCLEQEYSGLGRKIQENLVSVTPMNREQLRAAIALPAEQVNLGVEEALIEQMLRDIEGSPGSLPLLEYTLTRLWEERTGNQLKLSTYAHLGGIGGTLDSRATEVYRQFSQEEQKIAKLIFLSLTQLGEGTEDTRRRVTKSELMTEKHPEAAIEKVIQKLADEKLIVTSEQTGKVIIDVAHEALIRHWQQLRKWIEENRDALGRQRKIEEEAQYWLKRGKDKEYLWTGRRLEEAVEIRKEYAATVTLGKLEQEFLEASSKAELINYLSKPEIDNLDQEAIEKEAIRRSYLSKERLRELIEDGTERTGVGLAASWLLEQWGEKMPVRTVEVDKQGNIRLRIIENLPPIVREELEGGISLEMVEIPGGEFMMGASDEEEGAYVNEQQPRHKVKVSPFLIGKYPITREQWRAVASLPKVELDLNPEPSTYRGEGVPERILNRYPVTNFRWYEAVEFCQRLSNWSGEKGKGYEYRLPSEAEWEYACRAGKETPYHWGYKITPNLGNYIEKALGRLTPVGRFQVANAFGLYDVHGNVYEWCEDDWHDDYKGATEDGKAWLIENENDSQYKLLRGGSFINNSDNCRSAFRLNYFPVYRRDYIGLRVAANPMT